MERNYFKRIASAFLSVMLVLTSVSIAPAAQVSDTVQTQSVSTRKYANIVVFVDFKDTTHEHEKTELGKCYKEDPKITEYFEGDEEHPRALKQYVSNISYGQLNVQNIIPQYDSENNKIEPYVLSNDVSYYGDRTVGTSGPALGDTRMVKEISELLAKDSRFPKDAIVDYDGDGCVDNLMIVTACEKGNSNSQMYGHKSTYAGTDEINSKKIGSYTVIPEGLAYFGLSETGVVIHEFMHTLGYPDLYVNTNVSGVVPVGQWDIMAMVSKFLQYPLAYFRSAYSGWFDIPTVTESKKNCSIYAASSTTFDTRNNQAVILRTDYSSNEFFVVEYRKQKAKYDVASYDDKSYEGKIYGSGLIIYRINASLIGGNMYGPPYKAYVFRPGDSILNGYEKADYTNLDKSFLSAESGRTSYGTHDKNAGIADNAITYSDGTNSGIVIENVGSASGDTITFDISFADDGQEGRWITESTDTLGLSLSDIETYTDSEQNKYFIANIGDGYGYATNDTVLFKYSDGAWSKITDGPKAIYDGKSIVTYNGDVYISYLDTNCYARVDKWNGSSWQNIYKASGYSDNVSLVAGSEGIYFSYTSQDNSNIYAYKYDGNTLKNLSDNILAGAVSSMPANAAISVDADENIFVEYRDTANNSNIYIKKYNQIDNSWNAVLNGSIQANEVVLSNNNGKLYLFKKGTAFDTVKDSYLYSLDYANSAKEWTQVGTNSITDKGVNNASLCFDGDNVYVGTTASDNITFVSGLVDGEWQQLGTNVSIQDISGLNISYGNSKIYATYLDSDTGKAVVRSYEVKSADKPEQPVEVPITEVQLGREALDMYEGDTFKLTATVLPVNTTDSKDISWSSNNEAVATVSEDGTVTAKSVGTALITATSTNGKTASCTVTVNKKNTYTGLRDVDGQLKYFNNGNIDTTYTGFADYEGNRYYVSNGVVDTTYTSLILDNGNWVYVENGKVNNDYTGLVNYEGLWFYVDNGTIDWGYTGLADYNGIWFYVSGGIVDWNYTGLTYYNDVWFYISGGMIDWSYTGLVYYNDIWFYVSGGILDWDYIGLTSYNGIWFMISGGMINWDYAGLVYYNDMWFYVSGGTINWDYAGLIYYNDAWFYVSGGTINWTTAIVDYNGAKFYVQNGMVDWDYTGTVNYNGSTYNVINGMA